MLTTTTTSVVNIKPKRIIELILTIIWLLKFNVPGRRVRWHIWVLMGPDSKHNALCLSEYRNCHLSNDCITTEDDRTKRGSSHIGCKLRKMAKTLSLPILYTLMLCCVFQCLIHMLWTSVYCENYTDGRNLSPEAETDTNSIFKILWLNPLLVLGSSTGIANNKSDFTLRRFVVGFTFIHLHVH